MIGNKDNSRKGNKGMSLLEVMASLFILSFGLLGLIYMQLSLQLNSARGHDTLQALYYAESYLEGMRDNSALIPPEAGGLGELSSRVTPTEFGVDIVEVTYQWTDSTGRVRDMSIMTALSTMR